MGKKEWNMLKKHEKLLCDLSRDTIPKKGALKIVEKEDSYRRKTLIFLIVTLAGRFLISSLVYGYPGDVGCFARWSEYLARFGLRRIYSGEIFVDYPPGYMYPLWIIGKIRNLLQIPLYSEVYLVLLKMPSVVADFWLSIFLYWLGKERLGNRGGFFLSLSFFLNPAIILNSTLWGQVDSFFLLPLVGGIFLLSREQLEWSVLLWVLSFLIKPQALFLAPLWLFAFFEKKDPWITLRSVLVGVGTFILLSLPFSGPRTVLKVYLGTMSSYPYATLNAFNFWALLGGNWIQDNKTLFFLSFRHWGYLGISVTVFWAVFLFFHQKSAGKVALLAAFLSFSVFLFAPRMHERYLFPALFFVLLWYLFEPRRELVILYVGLSVSFFVNVGLVLLWALLFGVYHVPRWDFRLLLVGVLNCALWVFMVWCMTKKPESEGLPV